jgi:2-keto-4-pentenoate hydratase/2-oxohepta-3-ene-1,7-dioic acid hydratase in catechol pathway
MRLATVIADSRPRLVGQVRGQLIDLQKASALIGSEALPCDMLDLLDGGPALLKRCRETLEMADGVLATPAGRSPLEAEGAVYSPDGVGWLSPLPRPRKIICVGLNYRDHIEEARLKTPTEPFLFPKFSSASAGPYDRVALHSLTNKLDFEAELVAVIGRRAKNVPAGEAMDCVAGYMVGNDISARDLQETNLSLSKSGDGFAPMGPFLVTVDEVPDPHNLRVQSWLNGNPMQSSSTSYLIFRIPELIAYCSRGLTIEPGDVIFTGTPPGVGHFRQPPIYMKPGDVLVTAVEGLGELRNTIVDG